MSARRVPFVTGVLALAGLFQLPRCSAADTPAWSIEVAADGTEATFSSIRWNPIGKRFAVAVSGDRLRYAELDGTDWATETVDDEACSRALSLGFDRAGEPVIAYQDALHAQLRLARRAAGAWKIEVLDVVTTAGNEVSLAFDPSGNALIAFTGSAGAGAGLLLARAIPSGAWAIELVEAGAGVGLGASLALAPDGQPWVSYHVSTPFGIKLARFDGLSWASEIAVATDGHMGRTSLAFDPLGRPVIAFGLPDDSVRCSHWNGMEWVTETVAIYGWVFGERFLLFDAAGTAVIAYCGVMADLRVYVARRATSSWATQLVTESAGGAPSLALDDGGRIALSFNPTRSMQRPETTGIAVGRASASSWLIDRLADTLSYERGVALFFNAAGEPAVTSFERAQGQIMYASRTGASWQTEPVASATYPNGMSLAIDGEGIPFVAWRDSSAAQVQVAHRSGSGWVIDLVAAANAAPSFAVSATGTLTFAFVPVAADQVRLAHWNGSGWDMETVTPAVRASPVVHAYTPDRRPAVAFYDNGTKLYRYAEWDGLAWQVRDVASAPSPGTLSLAFDASGRPHVAWKDPAAKQLMYSRWDGAAWLTEPVLALDIQEARLAIDGSGTPWLAWTASSSLDIGPHLARREAGVWLDQAIDESCIGSGISLALTPAGSPALAYLANCRGDIRLAEKLDVTLLRGVVAGLTGQWKAAALPLDSTRDDATAPFPVRALAAEDGIASSAPLVLYRALAQGDLALGNGLRVVRGASGPSLSYRP